MAKSKIRKDRHGLYVRANYYIFRPQRAEFEPDHANRTWESRLIGGEPAMLNPIAQTSHCTVKAKAWNGTVKEVWGSHGTYRPEWMGGILRDSELVWNPKERILKKYKVSWTEKHEFTTEAENAEDAMEESLDYGEETFIEGSDKDLTATLVKEE